MWLAKYRGEMIACKVLECPGSMLSLQVRLPPAPPHRQALLQGPSPLPSQDAEDYRKAAADHRSPLLEALMSMDTNSHPNLVGSSGFPLPPSHCPVRGRGTCPCNSRHTHYLLLRRCR